MSSAMHSWYLRNMYKDNNLCKPNKLSIKGTPIDISSIDIPVCFISAVEDHIAPWLSTYSGAKFDRYHYLMIHKHGLMKLKLTKDHGGQTGIHGFVHKQAKQLKHALKAEGGLEVIEAAPGTYVKCKIDDPSPVVEYTKLDPAKKPVAKKAEAKKPAAKKPVAKKAEAKKPAAKKPVAKKAEVKKPAAKKTEAKKPEVKKPATKKAATVAKAKPAAKAKTVTKKAKPQESQAQLDLKAEQPKKQPAKKAAAPKTATASKTAKDDLTVISGIGPKVAEMLNSLGINGYSDLAAMTPKQILEKMDTLDVKNRRFDTSTWPTQAKDLIKKSATKK
ncbi:Neurofilament medium polypeptide [Nymphon striatum]|nr:Neurofilament medium polypeptide [Nymphon striatum]